MRSVIKYLSRHSIKYNVLYKVILYNIKGIDVVMRIAYIIIHAAWRWYFEDFKVFSCSNCITPGVLIYCISWIIIYFFSVSTHAFMRSLCHVSVKIAIVFHHTWIIWIARILLMMQNASHVYQSRNALFSSILNA